MIYILGIFVSLLVQVLKKRYSTGSWQTIGILLVVSFVGAIGYSYAQASGFWGNIAQVLTTAGAFYTFIIQRFETPTMIQPPITGQTLTAPTTIIG